MKEHNLNIKDFILDEIESIELIGEKDTIDIEVNDTHMFFANDIYTHNSSTESEVIQASQVWQSYNKIMVSDFIMSFTRKDNDKVSKTAKYYIVKNRFGPDGLTFNAKFDPTTSRIHIYEKDSIEGAMIQVEINKRQNVTRLQLAAKYKKLNENQ